MFKVNNICFSYNRLPLLNEISFSLKQGEIVSLIGSSGSGKSTLFKILTGLLQPHKGEITIEEEVLPAAQKHIAYMMQEDLLLPWRTIEDNMSLPLELGPHPQAQRGSKKQIWALLDEMGLPNVARMYPGQLSGGMKQRVSLARALLLQRPVLLLDEPFGSLDASLREQMYALLRKIQNHHQITILLVTHDFRDAISLSDRIFLLKDAHLKREWIMPSDQRKNPYFIGSHSEEMLKALQDF